MLGAWSAGPGVRKTGSGTSSTIDIVEVTPLWEYELPDGTDLLERDEDDEPVEDEDGNLVFREGVDKLVNNQLDFQKVHKPYDNDYIANLLKRDNPFRSGGARRYRKESDSDESDNNDSDDDPPKKARKGRRSPRSRARR